AGNVITADFDETRGGTPPLSCTASDPLIEVSCTGSTVVGPVPCSVDAVDPAWFDGPALSCAVTRRDAATCTETSSTETPRFWLADGVLGPGTELHTDSPALVEL